LDEEKTSTVKRVFELKEAMPDASLQKIAGILKSNFTACRLNGS
jgi:hypothetical protein